MSEEINIKEQNADEDKRDGRKKKRKQRLKKFYSEFGQFLKRGNVIELAVAVIIGGAFNKIVTGLVNYIVSPIIGLAVGGVDLSQLKYVIVAADEASGRAETAIMYGAFIQAIIDFLIIAFTVFFIVKIMNRTHTALKGAAAEIKKKLAEEQSRKSDSEPLPAAAANITGVPEDEKKKAEREQEKPQPAASSSLAGSNVEKLLEQIVALLKEERETAKAD